MTGAALTKSLPSTKEIATLTDTKLGELAMFSGRINDESWDEIAERSRVYLSKNPNWGQPKLAKQFNVTRSTFQKHVVEKRGVRTRGVGGVPTHKPVVDEHINSNGDSTIEVLDLSPTPEMYGGLPPASPKISKKQRARMFLMSAQDFVDDNVDMSALPDDVIEELHGFAEWLNQRLEGLK